MNPLVSVIVPVYNSEKYLNECVESILLQSYPDFELILINDGSTDGSREICDGYACSNERIKVFHKENGGVSSARNLGLSKATGEWLTFVDSDDKIETHYLKHFIQETSGVDLIYQGLTRFSDDHDKKDSIYSFPDELHTVFSLFQKYMVTSRGYAAGKLLKNSIIRKNQISFDTTLSFAEDSLFFLKYLSYVDKIKLSSRSDYLYRKNTEGLSTLKYSTEKELELLRKVDLQVKDLFNQYRILNESDTRYKELQYYIHRILYSIRQTEDRVTRVQRLKDFIEEHYAESLFLFKAAKGGGKLLHYAIYFRQFSLLDFLFRKLKRSTKS